MLIISASKKWGSRIGPDGDDTLGSTRDFENAHGCLKRSKRKYGSSSGNLARVQRSVAFDKFVWFFCFECVICHKPFFYDKLHIRNSCSSSKFPSRQYAPSWIRFYFSHLSFWLVRAPSKLGCRKFWTNTWPANIRDTFTSHILLLIFDVWSVHVAFDCK